MQKGLIHLYIGDGKGKTTAAVGLAVRAAGAGLRVGFVQFMKGQDSAEIISLEKLGVEVVRASGEKKFVFQMDTGEKQAYRLAHRACFTGVCQQAAQWDVLVLDEAMSAMQAGMLEENAVLAFLHSKPPHLEVVLTGRNPPATLKTIADYITEMRAEKHPFGGGVFARQGIEY